MDQKALRLLAKRLVKGPVNKLAAVAGLEIRGKGHDWSDVANFIPFRETVEAAKAAGLTVGDYIDSVMNNIPGATQAAIAKVAALGAISERTHTIVEIGPGSGRYLEQVLKLCTPTLCQIYETSDDWADYVASTYRVTRCPTDGRYLGATETASVDLVQAYKVMSTIPFLGTARYWVEMARVTRVGGYAVFDIVTEECLEPATVRKWARIDVDNGSYPAVMPRRVALDFFGASGFQFRGSFFSPMGMGTTETFVFQNTNT